MTACEQVRGAVLQRLEAEGIDAISAFEKTIYTPCDKSLIVVGVRQEKLQRVGLSDYLGERFDATLGETVEVYGRELKMVLSLDAYASRTVGAAACDSISETAAQALSEALPCGIRLETMSFEETAWNKQYEMFIKRGTVCCTAHFTAESREQEPELRDYILKGVVQD